MKSLQLLTFVLCLLVASSGWKRWAERRVPDSLAGRTLGQGLAATATINVIFFCLMGAMAPSSSTIARSVQRWRCWLSPSLRPVPRSSISASMEMMRAFPSGSKAPSCG